MTSGNNMCPFCRTPLPTSDDAVQMKMVMKRVEIGDVVAIHNLAGHYSDGIGGFPLDRKKALELWHRAAELDYIKAYNNIGYAYHNGEGVERDMKKATHYYELAAMGGDVFARYNLGNEEERASNYGRALKHFMIAVGSGDNGSLQQIKELYLDGHATKDDYAKALKAYQAYLGEIKSDQRDKAAEYSDNYKYYE